MHDVAFTFESNIQEFERWTQIMAPLMSDEQGASPIRYRNLLQEFVRLQSAWSSHMHSSLLIQGFIAARAPHRRPSLRCWAVQQEEILRELSILAPIQWPRTPQLGLSSLRSRALTVIPRLLLNLEFEAQTIVPLVRRWTANGESQEQSLPDEESSPADCELLSA